MLPRNISVFEERKNSGDPTSERTDAFPTTKRATIALLRERPQSARHADHLPFRMRERRFIRMRSSPDTGYPAPGSARKAPPCV